MSARSESAALAWRMAYVSPAGRGRWSVGKSVSIPGRWVAWDPNIDKTAWFRNFTDASFYAQTAARMDGVREC